MSDADKTKPLKLQDPNKTKIEGAGNPNRGQVPAAANIKTPTSHHVQRDSRVATKEGRADQMKQINLEAARNLRPGSANGSNELIAGIKNMKSPSIIDRLKSISSKAIGGVSKLGSSIKPVGNLKPTGKPDRASQMKEINSMIGSRNSAATAQPKAQNTNAGVQTAVLNKPSQPKVQNAAPMPGVNQKMAKSINDMMDLLKGQMSKLGKPGLSEQMGHETKAWISANQNHPMVQAASKKPAVAAATPVSVAPPHASMTQPSSQPAMAVPAKPKSAHVMHAHEQVQSKAHHNKLAANLQKVKKPAAKPSPEANPQPQDHAVKSPENAQHFKNTPRTFKSSKVIPAGSPKAQAVAPTAETTKKSSSKIIPRESVQNKQAVSAAAKKKFESEKTADYKESNDGWGGSSNEKTLEATGKKKGFNEESTKKDIVSNGDKSKGSGTAKQRPDSKFESERTAPLENEAKTSGNASGSQPPSGKSASEAAPVQNAKPLETRHLGVQKPFQMHSGEAHSHLMNFLHQLVNPGSIPNQTPANKQVVQHSQHFMQKSESMHILCTSLKSKVRTTPKNEALDIVKADEVTQKESVGDTSIKIKQGSKKEPATKQASLLTDPNNYPNHSRKKIVQMIGKCSKTSH